MEIIIVLIGFSLAIALFFLVAFAWSVKSGQYDDTYTPSIRMLFSEKASKQKTNNTNQIEQKDLE